MVPSLRVQQGVSSVSTNFFICGLGNEGGNAGIEPSVGVFIDGVYRSRSAAQVSDLTNITRIEVLRGPQSTLLGKNASAGVISIITQNPSSNMAARPSSPMGTSTRKSAKPASRVRSSRTCSPSTSTEASTGETVMPAAMSSTSSPARRHRRSTRFPPRRAVVRDWFPTCRSPTRSAPISCYVTRSKITAGRARSTISSAT